MQRGSGLRIWISYSWLVHRHASPSISSSTGTHSVAWDDQVVTGSRTARSRSGDVLAQQRWGAGRTQGCLARPRCGHGSREFLVLRSLPIGSGGRGAGPTADGDAAAGLYDTAVIPNGATAAEASRVIGVQGNLWTELMPSFADDRHALFRATRRCRSLGGPRRRPATGSGFLQRLGQPEPAALPLPGHLDYADSAFAPAFEVTDAGKGLLRVALSNQGGFGAIRFP